jgi:hypothetical protein
MPDGRVLSAEGHRTHVSRAVRYAGGDWAAVGYESNKVGIWSLRKYSISMIVKKFGIYLGSDRGVAPLFCWHVNAKTRPPDSPMMAASQP